MARRLGTGLLREAMALRGRMTLASYDRLFPSQDLVPVGGTGNLIAAPLFKPARDNGATVFLDLETLERHDDQWAYLSTLGRMTPQELRRAADRAGKVTVATEVTRLSVPSSTATRPPAPPVLSVRLDAGIRLEQAQLTPGLAATLRHAASMHNPEFYPVPAVAAPGAQSLDGEHGRQRLPRGVVRSDERRGGVLGGGQDTGGGQVHPGLGKDGPGMSRVGLDALNLPAVEQEPRSGSVGQPTKITCGRAALSHRLPPG